MSQPPSARQQPAASSSSSATGSSAHSNPGDPRVPASYSAQNCGKQQQPQPHGTQQQPQQQATAQNQFAPAHPAQQSQARPAMSSADELAALRARIIEFERGNTHGNPPLARVIPPQQGLVADPAEVECIHTKLAGAKDDSKKLTLPALHPGHKVSALSLRKYIAVFLPFKFRSCHFVCSTKPVYSSPPFWGCEYPSFLPLRHTAFGRCH